MNFNDWLTGVVEYGFLFGGVGGLLTFGFGYLVAAIYDGLNRMV